ncbi:MAG: DUF2384 domain-containing protein [Bergeyella sp.]
MKKYNRPDTQKTTSLKEPAVAYGNYSFDDMSVFNLMNTAKRGISFQSFDVLMRKFHFTMQDWADFLHISGKTLSRYQKEEKTFDALQSEKILQIELLYARGREVFGNAENFLIWLQTENLALGKIKPQDILDSVFGISLLMDELTRIEHGVLA